MPIRIAGLFSSVYLLPDGRGNAVGGASKDVGG